MNLHFIREIAKTRGVLPVKPGKIELAGCFRVRKTISIVLSWRIPAILRLLHLNLFEKRDLMALLRGDPLRNKWTAINQQALL